MPLPIYSCGHSHLPLPKHTTYPPPAHLPHPCRPCHMAACMEAEQDLHAKHDGICLHLEKLAKQKEMGLGRNTNKWDHALYEEMAYLQDRRERKLQERDMGIRKIWNDFDGLWGGGF